MIIFLSLRVNFLSGVSIYFMTFYSDLSKSSIASDSLIVTTLLSPIVLKCLNISFYRARGSSLRDLALKQTSSLMRKYKESSLVFALES
jgi:hypothetical protein